MPKEKTVARIVASRRGLVALVTWLVVMVGDRAFEAFLNQLGLGVFDRVVDDAATATLAATVIFLLLGVVRKGEERIEELHASRGSVESLNKTLQSTVAAHQRVEQRLRVTEQRFLLATLATQDTIWE